ncbi:hypothetical protein BDV93DRAFT_515056 [Ceratobasidium sp. AG-I]|nr:hypothetical protein BDV93DRAFT_515056 [Ceratobasidium sp. AG-I]
MRELNALRTPLCIQARIKQGSLDANEQLFQHAGSALRVAHRVYAPIIGITAHHLTDDPTVDSLKVLQSTAMLTPGVRWLYQASVKIYIISEFIFAWIITASESAELCGFNELLNIHLWWVLQFGIVIDPGVWLNAATR